jgi:alkylation response protein AidB-like acyl-CoA dehydrogenase
MEFALSDTQLLLQSQMAGALGRLSPLERVRRHAGEPDDAFAADVWEGLTASGVPAMLVPEALGGLGLTLLDAALISELLGRHAVPAPFLGPCVAGPLAILASGSEAQRREWLPHIADGSVRMAIAVLSPGGVRAGEGFTEHGGRLEGECRFAIDAAGSGMLLAESLTGGLHLVSLADPAVEIVPLATIDRTRSAAAITLHGAAATPLGAAPGAAARIAHALQVMLAADLLGAASRMLETAVEYAGVRQQFGRPIGSFQAVQHLCADMAAELEPGRALVWYAAHALDEGLPDAALCALHAKALLADAGALCARNAVEVHGGIGITDALGLHYWFKRIGWSSQALGGASRCRDLAAAWQAGEGGLAPAAVLQDE